MKRLGLVIALAGGAVLAASPASAGGRAHGKGNASLAIRTKGSRMPAFDSGRSSFLARVQSMGQRLPQRWLPARQLAFVDSLATFRLARDLVASAGRIALSGSTGTSVRGGTATIRNGKDPGDVLQIANTGSQLRASRTIRRADGSQESFELSVSKLGHVEFTRTLSAAQGSSAQPAPSKSLPPFSPTTSAERGLIDKLKGDATFATLLGGR